MPSSAALMPAARSRSTSAALRRAPPSGSSGSLLPPSSVFFFRRTVRTWPRRIPPATVISRSIVSARSCKRRFSFFSRSFSSRSFRSRCGIAFRPGFFGKSASSTPAAARFNRLWHCTVEIPSFSAASVGVSVPSSALKIVS